MSASTCSEVLDNLLAEHAGLRGLMSLCETESRRILTGENSARHLLACVLQLVDAVESHNLSEEAALRPILLDTDSFGEVRVDQMMEDHVAEHMSLRQLLRQAVELEVPDRAARAVLDAMRLLRDHMEGEEAQFLNARVLRDDLMPIDTSCG
jgi:hypothetical protein